MLGGFACAFAGLCYAEFASIVPIAGSAYTYAYATMGEFIAWIIGWDLILEYALGAATVAIGWSGYFVSFLHDSASRARRFAMRRSSTPANMLACHRRDLQPSGDAGDRRRVDIAGHRDQESARVNNVIVAIKVRSSWSSSPPVCRS